MTDSTPPPQQAQSRSAFFYGTLMAPQVLHRVCHGSSNPSDNPIFKLSNFQTRPAILPDHRRHRVRGADYPAILSHAGSSVRGTYVTGLTDADVWRLDIFEGEEYRREKVKARVLTGEKVGDDVAIGELTREEDGSEEVEAETYIWSADPDDLEDAEWDFREFQREKMRFWVGSEGQGEYAGRASIVEVDEAVAAAGREGVDGTRGRGTNGHIGNALKAEHEKDQVLKNAV